MAKRNYFRKLDEITNPDIRLIAANIDESKYLISFYSKISDIKLSASVPRDVYINFETAKNTLLYSYYCYRLTMPAMIFSLAVLEQAIALKAHAVGFKFSPHCGLKRKLKTGIRQRWLDVSKLSRISGWTMTPDEWTNYIDNAFIPWFVELRNDLAHCPSLLDFPINIWAHMKDISELINQLFE